MKMIGYDDCIAGVVTRCGQLPIICYDRQKVLQRLIDDGMSKIDAEDFIEFNMNAWVGEQTPCFIEPFDESIFEQ